MKIIGVTATDTELAAQARAIRRLERRGPGPWHYVGDAGEPAFQNGWANIGGGLMSLRFRWNLSGNCDIEGSIAGDSYDTVVFDLPDGYYDPDGEVRLLASDDNGSPVAVRIVPRTSPTVHADVIIGVSPA